MADADHYWEVRVDCWCRYKPSDRPKRVTRWFIVRASEADVAMKFAVLKAEATAAMGPKWIGFEAIQAATITLPVEVGKHGR